MAGTIVPHHTLRKLVVSWGDKMRQEWAGVRRGQQQQQVQQQQRERE
jgi:hypothetical protein